MLLVAAYFWAPLVMGALPARKDAKNVTAVSDVILTDDPLDKAKPTQSSKNAFHWERVQQAMAADATMASATFDETWRNPFVAFAGVPVAIEEKPEPMPLPPPAEAIAQPQDVSPAEAGLVLQGILVGRDRSAATISGEVYREGDLVPASTGGSTMEFKVGNISKQGVELRYGSKQHWLEFSKSKLAPGDEILRRGQSDN